MPRIEFGGKACLDPVALWEDARSVQPPLPTWNWWGKVNSFRCPAGAEPGKGWLLLHRGDLDALNLNTTHDLVLEYNRQVTVKSLLVLHAECITPRELDNTQSAYVVEVADTRHLLKSFSPLVDKAYNVRSSPGSTTFLDATLNTGSEWTWTALASDLWTAVGTSRLGSYPGLPFSPHGNPEGFEFFQTNAYDALNQVLDRLCCVLTLNPFTAVFGIARVGSTDQTNATALLRWNAERIWDDDPEESNLSRLPQYVRVLFRRQPEPTDGNSPWYSVDVADTSPATGFYSGGYVPIHDDLTALGSSGTPSNSAALALRAAERAADWFRATREGWSRLRKIYRDTIQETGFVPGSKLTGLAVEDRGLGYKTEIARVGQFRDLSRVYRLAETMTPVCWARITAATDFAYTWVEAETITPTSGTFATASGTSFQDKSGGRSGTLNLYERNRFPNIPIDSYVQIYQGYGNTYLCEYDYDHFPAIITAESGDGIYTVTERYPPDTGISNARSVSATEFNFTESIAVGTVVMAWVYKLGTTLEYWFEYARKADVDASGCANCFSPIPINVEDPTDFTGICNAIYYNIFDSLIYLYLCGVGGGGSNPGWYPVCCATGARGSGSGTGSGSGGGTANIVTSCCPGGLPRTLYAHIANGTGCACLDGVTVTLTWNGSLWTSGDVTVCGGTTVFYFTCGGGDCTGFLFYATGYCQITVAGPHTCNCATPSFEFTNSVSVCCTGGIATTVNATP